MATHNPNARKLIDEYIAKSPKFAHPICKKLREIIHKAEPEIIEDWKWGPNFSKNGMVCNFGAFKQHVGLAFFRGASMRDPKKLFIRDDAPAKTMRRINFSSIDDIHEPTLVAYIREAVKANKSGIKTKNHDKTIHIPDDLKILLNRKIRKFFDSLSYTNRKEYIRWIETSKKEETRQARLQKILRMLAKNIQHP